MITRFLLLISCLFLCVFCQSIGQNLDFEQAFCPDEHCYIPYNNSGNIVPLPGWNSHGLLYIRRQNQNICPPSGNWAIVLAWNRPFIEQNLTTQVGAVYQVSVQVAPFSEKVNFTLTAGSESNEYFWKTPVLSGCGLWYTETITFTATSESTLLRITGTQQGDIGIDDVSIQKLTCETDTDCSGHGKCVVHNQSAPSFCSCYTGYHGVSCERKFGNCRNMGNVTRLASNFQPSAYVDWAYSTVTVGWTSTMEKGPVEPSTGVPNTPPYSLHTVAYFGANKDSFPECRYPNDQIWRDDVYDCKQYNFLILSWEVAKELCGFTLIPGTNSYSQMFTIEKYYLLDDNGLQRVQRYVKNQTFDFTQNLDVIDSITLKVPAPEFAVTEIEFNPTTGLWTYVVATALPYPYHIASHNIDRINGDVGLYNRLVGSQLAICDNSSTCIQSITFQFNQGSRNRSCEALHGSIMTSLVIGCDQSASSQCHNAYTITSLTLPVETGDSCETYVSFGAWTWFVISSDAGLNTRINEFYWNETAYIGVGFFPYYYYLEVTVETYHLEGTLCFKMPNGTCIEPHYTMLPPTGGYSMVFSITFSDPANAALFNPLETINYTIFDRLVLNWNEHTPPYV